MTKFALLRKIAGVLLACMECGHNFRRKYITFTTTCPKCHGSDVETA